MTRKANNNVRRKYKREEGTWVDETYFASLLRSIALCEIWLCDFVTLTSSLRHFIININGFCRFCPHNHTSTAYLPYFISTMPPKRKPATPSSRKRTPKKSQKASTSRNIHYPGGGLQTTFAVEGMSLLIPGEASETQTLGQHHGHQDPQGNDPFVGYEGNVIADIHTQVCFYFYFKFFF